MCEPFYKKTRVGAGEELTRVVFLMRGHGKRQREARQATTGTYPSGQRRCAANLRSGRTKGARPNTFQIRAIGIASANCFEPCGRTSTSPKSAKRSSGRNRSVGGIASFLGFYFL